MTRAQDKTSTRIRWFIAACLLAGLLRLSVAAETAAGTAPAPEDDEIQALFDQGLEAMRRDHVRTAREAFEEVLRRNPHLQRARLELANAYYRSLDYAKARELAEQVLDAPETPPEVRVSVLAFLAQIKQEELQFAKRHRWTPSIYAGYMYDSNVNVGPVSDILQFQGNILNLLPGSSKTSDSAFVINPGIAHSFNPGKTFQVGEQTAFLLWDSQANLYHRQYFSETDFNLTVLSASTGPRLIATRHWQAGLRLQADYIWLGADDLALFTSLVPSVSWQTPLGIELTVDGIVGYRDYIKNVDQGRDGTYTAAGGSIGRYFLNRRLSLQAGGRYANLDARQDRFSYYGPELFVGAEAAAWRNGTVYGRISYRNLNFRGPEPFPFGIPRDDEEWRYMLGFEHLFTGGPLNRWSLIGNWIRTDNSSNVPLYVYDRDQINLGLSRSF